MALKNLQDELNEKNQELLKYLESRLGKVARPANNMEEVFKSIKERNKLFRLESDVIDVVNKMRQAKSLSKIQNPFFEREQRDNKYEEAIATAILELAQYGWYVNYEFSPIDIVEAYKFCKKNDIESLDAFMSPMVSNQVKHIESLLIERHSERSKPLEAAFRAHRSKEYYLSIPVFFAQADGISKDLSQFQFFLNNKQFSPQVSSWAEANPKIWIHVALCAALKQKGAFQKHFTEPNKIGFTRHSILHGESNDYGTEINSLKAISLVSYISDVMSPLKLIVV